MNLKDIVLAIAIIILTIFVTFYGINTIFPKFQYEDFCEEFKTAEIIDTQVRCEELGGKWGSYEVPRPVIEGEMALTGYCDRDYTCRQDLEEANEIRSKYVFFIALPLGIIIILLGMFAFGLEAIGVGIMGGGVGTLVYGSGAFWPYTKNWARFLISLVGLVVLICLVYYFNKRGFGKKRKK
ncbi:MAG: hypothetical protein KKF48_01155 [Nanoarchaeota archaeon]|nr:hypothetical protein [Nanoarchaeota archaeon]MBU1027631.1 hypothetical protein [Nanoarchaeota archaeon]